MVDGIKTVCKAFNSVSLFSVISSLAKRLDFESLKVQERQLFKQLIPSCGSLKISESEVEYLCLSWRQLAQNH